MNNYVTFYILLIICSNVTFQKIYAHFYRYNIMRAHFSVKNERFSILTEIWHSLPITYVIMVDYIVLPLVIVTLTIITLLLYSAFRINPLKSNKIEFSRTPYFITQRYRHNPIGYIILNIRFLIYGHYSFLLVKISMKLVTIYYIPTQ